MKRVLPVALLVFALSCLSLPVQAGVTMGGKPYVPGADLPVGGVTMGGRPFVEGGAVFTPRGFGLGAQWYDEGGAPDPYSGLGVEESFGWVPSWSWFGWDIGGIFELLLGWLMFW